MANFQKTIFIFAGVLLLLLAAASRAGEGEEVTASECFVPGQKGGEGYYFPAVMMSRRTLLLAIDGKEWLQRGKEKTGK